MGRNKTCDYVTIMNTKSKEDSGTTILLPMKNGDILEINCSKKEIKEFVAPAPMVEEITKKCTPVATSSEYNLLVLNF